MTNAAESKRYPRFSRRVAAVVVDSMIYLVLFIALAVGLAHTGFHFALKIAIAGFVLLLMEPILVSSTGASLGQHWRGLKVLRADTGANLELPRAFLRYILKTILGLYSLVLILLTKRHQAVHDWIAGSVVVLKNPEAFAEQDVLGERMPQAAGFEYPTALRRVLCIIGYNVVWLVALVTVFSLVGLNGFISLECLEYDRCGQAEDLVLNIVALVWLAGLFAIIVFGWRGQLWGCRRTRV